MKFPKSIIFLSFFLLTQGHFDTVQSKVETSSKGKEIREEDLEIIENLDFLENLDLFEEELEFLEDYLEIDQSKLIGDNDE